LENKRIKVMKFTKKQITVGVVVSLLIAGGAVGIVANHNAQVAHAKQVEEQKQAEEKAKAAYKKLQEAAQTAVTQAETFKSEADIKSANTAISKLKKENQSPFAERIQKVTANWKAVHETEKLVTTAEKARNDKNVAAAQKSIDQLSTPMVKAQKLALQKRLDVVKKSISDEKAKARAAAESKAKAEQEAQKQAEAAKKAEATNNAVQATSDTPTPNNEASTPAYTEEPAVNAPSNDNNNSYTPPTNNGGGNSGNTGGGTTPSQPKPPTGGNTGGGGGSTTPPPATTYTGWVRNKEGQIVWQQGGFPTSDAAYAAAANWLNTNATSGGWSCGSN